MPPCFRADFKQWGTNSTISADRVKPPAVKVAIYVSYQIDPPGSISIIDISNPQDPQVSTAGFSAFDADTLRSMGVRIYGPGADVAMDLEPEYIALSADGQGLPIDMRLSQIITVVLLSLLLCLCASIYPARKAMKTQPSLALQNE